MKHIDIIVRGKVQGVFFRASAKKEAEALGLTGHAKNMDDGTVFIEVEGEEGALRRFSDWCRRGPAHAKVTDVTAKESHQVKNLRDFLTL